MSELKEVRIGERNVTVPRFTGFKITRAMRLIATISKAYPDALAQSGSFKRLYSEANATRITQDMAKMPRFSNWKLTAKDFGERGYIELPAEPTFRELMLAIFPQVLEAAEQPLLELMALVIAPNNEIKTADVEGGDDAVDAYLSKAAKELLHEANFEELLTIAAVAVVVVQEQIAEKEEDAGKLFGLLGGQPSSPTTTSSDENDENEQTSSNGSRARTGGRGAKSSTKSTG